MLSLAPALPSCGEAELPAGAAGPGLSEDIAAVRQALLDSDEPTVVVAHSYGGIITAEAAAGVGTVRHLVMVSSYLPEVGQSLSDFGDAAPPRSLTSTPTPAPSGSAPSSSWTHSSRTANPRSKYRRRIISPGRACR